MVPTDAFKTGTSRDSCVGPPVPLDGRAEMEAQLGDVEKTTQHKHDTRMQRRSRSVIDDTTNPRMGGP